MNTDALRTRYQPKSVRVLLVGESPPVGGTFFYAGNSNLFRYTKQAFEMATNTSWPSNESFLDFFREHGYFLDDLCLEPVNGLTNSERRRCRKAGVKPLAQRLSIYKPETVLVTPKAILSQVNAALKIVHQSCTPIALPFPAMSWQQKYVDELVAILHKYGI